MAFMRPVYVQGVFGRIEDKHGETRLVPIEYAEIEDDETCEEVAGWVCQLSANGYMDQTDWHGPFETEQEARDQEGQFLPRTPSRAGVRAEPVAYVPPKLPLLPLGATTSPEPVDMEAHRQRGLVGNFIRSDGMEWRGGGPDPLDPRCQLRGDVLAEFVVKLQHVRVVRDRKRQEAAEMRASGVPA